MNLLVVDWDYFFPVEEMQGGAKPEEWTLYDWRQSEEMGRQRQAVVWVSRASSFLAVDKPLPPPNDEWRGFWDRFRFNAGVILYADSNMYAIEPLRRYQDFEAVWLFDAHHDCGYRKSNLADFRRARFSCESWMLAYSLASNLHVRYPAWRPYALELEPEPLVEVDRQVDSADEPLPAFDAVFLCRSGAWVPPWCDNEFSAFLDLFPGRSELVGPCEPREFNVNMASSMARATKDFLNRYQGEDG